LSIREVYPWKWKKKSVEMSCRDSQEIGGAEKMVQLIEQLSSEIKVPSRAVDAVLELASGGATVPFMARYRKEATGGLDEEQIRQIIDGAAKIETLEKRRSSILAALKEQEVLTPELEAAVKDAPGLTVLEDLYLPYRPKRKTRASVARDAGLEPLARLIIDGKLETKEDGLTGAANYVAPDKGIDDGEAALAGARDILSELFSESASVRGELRTHFRQHALLSSAKVKKACEKDPDGASRFRDYFDWSEKSSRAAGHRILALRRGEKLGFLKVHVLPSEDEALLLLKRLCMRVGGPAFVMGGGPQEQGGGGPQEQRGGGQSGEKTAAGGTAVARAGKDHIPLTGESAREAAEAADEAYRRLLAPSLEKELRKELETAAEQEAIELFGRNLRELLLQPPLGRKRVLAVDPGLRTGCKIALLDQTGRFLADDVIYPLAPHKKEKESAEKVLELAKRYAIEAVAVGNGTGGREALSFLSGIGLDPAIDLISVDESGASVYSASEIARKEFPNKDLTVRGTVSIGRRLQDPLSELVKVDPKSIGVGQYQHDVDQKALKNRLDQVVESCVNSVGVELNSASARLLSYVSGIGERLAEAIVSFRSSIGLFDGRTQLQEVSGLGNKAFEQAAGFLRIRGAKHPLDASAVHPERYALVEKMARDLGVSLSELLGAGSEARTQIDLKRYIDKDTGEATLRDILGELEKPGRDPREPFHAFSFAEGVNSMEDLEEGMVLPGIVTNLTAFGAFVDIGVHQDGLVHISEMADRFVKDPAEVVKLRQEVSVRVIGVDMQRRRIALSLKEG
jgi:protein Tex